jgi:uncharacterized membrane protein YeaQ/YmgE (transglycosylase-associated protein family)
MTILGFLILLVIAALVGIVGQALAGYSLGGLVISAVVGFIGALLGMWIARTLGLPEPLPITVEGETFPIFWAVIGSALFTALIGLLTSRRRTRRLI